MIFGKAAADLRRVRPRDDPDDLPRQFGIGVGGAGVEGLCVHHRHVGFLCRFVQGRIGHVVAVRRDQPDAALIRPQPQRGRHFRIDVGDDLHAQECRF